MNMLLKRLRFLVALLLAVVLIACASGPTQVFHSFQFDGRYDGHPNTEGKYEGWGKDVDLLAYSYGDQYAMVRNSLENPRYGTSLYQGKTSLPYSSGVSGPMPEGDFLYVKWRIKATGDVFEDRVNLKGRLPNNMTYHTLTFVPDGQQLHVFVITPTPNQETQMKVHFLQRKRTHLPTRSDTYKTYEIYPLMEPYPEQLERCLKGEFLCAVDKSKK